MHVLCMKGLGYDLLNAHGLNSIEAHQYAINISIESRGVEITLSHYPLLYAKACAIY